MRSAAALALAAIVLAASAATLPAQPAPTQAPAAPSLRLRMLAAEDARDPSPAAIAPLIQGLRSPDAELRRVAVRALGRLERPELRRHIVPVMKDTEASVRAEAADALAQSLFSEGDAPAVGDAARVIADALRAETHPRALAAAIGRLRHPDDAAGQAVGMAVLDVAFPQDARGRRQPASAAVLIPALRGLHSVALAGVRYGAPRRDASGAAVTWLPDQARAALAALLLDDQGTRRPATTGAAAGPRSAAETTVRRLAVQVLAGTRRSYPAIGLALIDDPDDQVRALAIRWAVDALKDEPARAAIAADWARLRALDEPSARAWVATRVALLDARIAADPSAQVRFEAVRAVVQAALGARSCHWLLAAFDDADVNVARHALTNARQSCGDDAAVRARLEALSRPDTAAAGEPPAASGWHRGAYALVGYAELDAAAARPRVLAALGSAHAWVRRYAVLAAATVLAETSSPKGSDDALRAAVARLVDDRDENVATEAVRVLSRTGRDDVRRHALRALQR
ncbi:MAG: HEAT repeat domain-containing protein, partial [Vicinamibacterales bacterium]|nr:HEAT repeat domain-containing protein [Vicinamibacterales bacterium]